MKDFKAVAFGLAVTTLSMAGQVRADEIFYATGAVGNAIESFKKTVEPWEQATGNKVTLVPMPASTSDQFAQYRLWLAAGTADVDLYQTDVIWAPQMAEHFVDLSQAAKDIIPQHFPRSSSRRPSMASWWRSRCSPMRRRCIIARICLRNTARPRQRPGTR